ncbi:Acid sphingomyelinase phosphodiesterase 3a-like protein [Daphnia magna]|uniref:Sphingomyelin phosphodiesterase n=1 Tax=Daphnia magna TaxID=35525 RepID=A0A0N8DGZ8_9CRUS|nr:Acid sphingomyelinase phosphodiesterase 3a-like protein [Daphnia magna]
MMRWLSLFVIVLAGSTFTVLEGAPAPEKTKVLPTPPDDTERNVLTCSLCEEFVTDIYQLLRNESVTDEQIIDYVVNLCIRLDIFANPDQVCGGTALILLPTLKYIDSSNTVTLGNVCGMLIQDQNCGLSNPEQLEWTIDINVDTKPPVNQLSPPPEGSPTVKVLHLADIHWDPEYLAGSNAMCGDPLCCRATSGEVINATDAAGYWGDYRTCDLPWYLVENAVAQMAALHTDVSYIIWTGDLTPHDVWSTEKAENLVIIDRLMTLIQQYFPSVPVYPTLGNHESHPVNSFAPPEITDVELNTAWLYDEADRQWARWLPADASSTIRYGGYYTTLVQPGLRIISMNMNYCYTLNYWTYFKSQDPASSLLWLNQILEEAELNGEKVHILSHIPPGNSDCWTVFSREFAKIINRFESTVAAQFYGHTHKDEYKVFYDMVDVTRPINVAFIAPSLTTYSKLNPGYRTYTIDGQRPGSTWAVLDFNTYIMNLTDANLKGAEVEPVWTELYQAKQEYGLTDLSPQSMDALFQRMLTDDALFQLYFKNYYKNADEVVAEGCTDRCRSNLLCHIVTTDIGDQTKCEQIRHKIFSHPEF